jgi:heavy metal sensor kinase
LRRVLSVGAKWTLRYAVVTFVCVSLLGLYLYQRVERRIHRDAELIVELPLRAVGETMRRAPGDRDSAMDAMLRQVRSADDDLRLGMQLFDESGRLLMATGSLQERPVPLRPVLLDGGEVERWEVDLGEETPYYVMAARAPGGFVLAAVDSRRFRQHLSYVADGLGVALPIVLLVTAGLGWLLARGSLRPIQRMTHTARRISGANLDEKVPTSGSGDELDQLAVTLNEMMARIRESMARIRRFSGDAAHEIRTPLAAIRSQIEVTLELPRSREEYDQVLRQVLDEVDRLGRGADAILRLATSEAGLQRSQQSAVDLAEVLADLIAFFEPLAAEKDVKLSLALEPTPAVLGDPAWLHQLFANLVHNAIKFTPPGGSVRVELSQEPEVHAAAVAVRDTGVGIPREHLDRIFERFHKVDASRTEGGFGLGLSLAREIAKAHGGTIHVESEPGRGSVFRVLLPLEEGDEGSPD